jgi:transcriptional regulator GlxA family with amidase domain
VDEGKFVTSGGISAGIDMSLHLVERLAGRELALRTARQMEYRWEED